MPAGSSDSRESLTPGTAFPTVTASSPVLARNWVGKFGNTSLNPPPKAVDVRFGMFPKSVWPGDKGEEQGIVFVPKFQG